MALSGTLQLACDYVPVSTNRSFLSSSVSRTTFALSPFSSGHRNSASLLCRASSSNHRRTNPDFSRNNNNKHGSRSRRNRGNEDGLDNGAGNGFEDSEMLSSKNGPMFALSNSPKFQSTSSPGPREKEIVDLFRKVQAQLRARAAAKREDKKTEEATKGGGKENETVDSLLKLLRKHSGEQSKKKVNDDDSSDVQDRNVTSFTRPASSFKRNSPVPRRNEPQYDYSSEGVFDEESSYSVTWTHKKDKVEPRDEPELEPEVEPESFYEEEEEDHDVDVALDDELDDDEEEAEEEDEALSVEEEIVKGEDLSGMKLVELRGIAKARGIKGISKMKKAELLDLLNRG